MPPNAKRDENRVTTLIAVSTVDGVTPVVLYADPVTHRLYVDVSGGGGGGVWGSITGTLSNQSDLQTALDSKVSNELAIAYAVSL